MQSSHTQGPVLWFKHSIQNMITQSHTGVFKMNSSLISSTASGYDTDLLQTYKGLPVATDRPWTDNAVYNNYNSSLT